MKWSNLKVNKCPQCNDDFVRGLTVISGVLNHPCGFRIREIRYQQIVSSQVNNDLEEMLEQEQQL